MTDENIATICMVCNLVQDGNEWKTREDYEKEHPKTLYSHGVCDNKYCVNSFEAYTVGDFEKAVYYKHKKEKETEGDLEWQ